MRGNWLTGLGLLLAAVVLTGCNQNTAEENSLLTEENQSLREQLADRNQALDAVQEDLREKDRQIADLNRQLEEIRYQPASTSATSADPFGGIPGVTGSVSGGEVTATVESDVLFDSGKATLKDSAKRSLDAVAQILNTTYPGRSIRVAGHTDTDPIRKSGYKSNYHLGFERAYAVREYLISRGIAATRVSLASFGPDRARGSKAESRRVDIVVLVDD